MKRILKIFGVALFLMVASGVFALGGLLGYLEWRDYSRIGGLIANTPDGPERMVRMAAYGNISGVRAYLRNGLDINVRNKTGNTALYAAAGTGEVGMVRFLLGHQPPPNLELGPAMSTPMLQAHSRGFDNIETLLRKAKAYDAVADYTLLDKSGYPYTFSGLRRAIEKEDLKAVEIFLANAAHWPWNELEPLFEDNPLLVAVKAGKLKIAKMLFDKGANPNVKDRGGEPLLFWAIRQGSLSVADLLFKQGADPNWGGSQSPLMLAVREKRADFVKLLIAKGAQLDYQDHNGDNAITNAARDRSSDLVQTLLEAGANPALHNRQGENPLVFALERNDLEAARKLAAKDVRFEKGNPKIVLMLSDAVYEENLETVRFLLEHGADPNADVPLGEGFPPLFTAARKSHLELTTLLLKAGADPRRPFQIPVRGEIKTATALDVANGSVPGYGDGSTEEIKSLLSDTPSR